MRVTTRPLVIAMALSLVTGFQVQAHSVAAGVDGLSIHAQLADEWTAVLRIPAGREVRLHVDGKGIIGGRLVVADETGISLLNTDDPTIPGQVIKVCRDILRSSPSTLPSTLAGHEFLYEGVRVGPAGVFLRGHRVADLEQVLFRLDYAAIRTVAAESGRRKTGPILIAVGVSNLILGTALGAVVALVGDTLIIVGIVDHHQNSRRFDIVYTRPSP